MAPSFLSKSRYLNGLQCLKYLWLQVNTPDAIPRPNAQTQHLFDQGHMVQGLAERLFPGGVRVPESSFRHSIDLTAKFLKQGQPFFEAGILADTVYSRVDVLRPATDGRWDIIEVKSSTRVKDENVQDVSFQKYCCQKRGMLINKCYVLHINNKYVKRGEIDPAGLLTAEDVSDRVTEAEAGIETRVRTMVEAMASTIPPESSVGLHCTDPYECPVAACWETLPENTVLDLYRGKAKGFDLLNQGIRFLKDIPDSLKLTDAQKVQKWCDQNACHHADKVAIGSFLGSLRYPVHYLDFETFNSAVPLVDGIRPYQQVPFQFSLHVVDRPGSMAWKFGFLSDNAEDPRPGFIAELHRLIGNRGSVVVYNQSFEEGIMKELGEAFPEHKGWADSVCTRMVDLLDPFREFSYYHPRQRGSASIKQVMPALTGQGYDDLDISVGDEASLAYLDMTYGEMPDSRKAKTRRDLETYCGRDTEGMIWIVDALRGLAN